MEKAQTRIMESPEDLLLLPAVVEAPVTAGKGVKGSPRVELPRYKALINPNTGHAFSVVTPKYVLQKHEDVLVEVEDVLSENPEFGSWTRRLEVLSDGSRMHAVYTFPDITYDIADGNDPINPTVEVFNSYDLGWAKRLMFGAFRLVCKNGLVIGKQFAMYRREHHQITDRLIMGEVLQIGMDQFSNQIGLWRGWVDRVTTSQEYEDVMSGIGFNKGELETIGQEVEVSSNIRLDSVKTKTLTYWLFYNIIMQYLTHKVGNGNRRVDLQGRASRLFV